MVVTPLLPAPVWIEGPHSGWAGGEQNSAYGFAATFFRLLGACFDYSDTLLV